MPGPLRIRTAARAVVMDADHRVLLVHFTFSDDDRPTGFWACPGGGLDPGESLAQGVIRELVEEVGLTVTDVGEPIWWKTHHFPMTHWDGQHDTYFFVEVDRFEPRPTFSPEDLAAEGVDEIRWWDYEELLAAQAVFDAGDHDAENFVVFSPRRLGHLVADLVEHGRPTALIEVSTVAE